MLSWQPRPDLCGFSARLHTFWMGTFRVILIKPPQAMAINVSEINLAQINNVYNLVLDGDVVVILLLFSVHVCHV